MPSQADDPVVHELRAEIDAADRAVLDALNRRIAAVRRLHDHKEARSVTASTAATTSGTASSAIGPPFASCSVSTIACSRVGSESE